MKNFGLKIIAVLLACGMLGGAVSVCSGGQNVTLAWDSNTESSLAGYKIHYGVQSQVYSNCITVSKNATAVVSNLVEGVTYYFVATAYSATGTESLPSNEVSYNVPVLNHSPVGVNDLVFADAGTVSRFSQQIFTRNDSDPDQDPLTIGTVTAKTAMNGSAVLSGNYVLYTPVAAFLGDDSFVYTVVDGKGGSAQATVSVSVRTPVKSVRNPKTVKALTDGSRSVSFQGFPGSSFLVQASTNLVTWNTIATAVADNVGGVEIIDTQAMNYSSRYYRLTTP